MNSMPRVPHKSSQAGVTLIELMVSLVIGSLLIAGAMTVYLQSRSTYRVTEAAARLQEVARYALDTLDADVRMAGYWGLVQDPMLVGTGAGATDAVDDNCGANWATDVMLFVDGRDGIDAGNPTGTGYNLLCSAGREDVTTDAAVNSADVLIVRRASSDIRPVAGDGRMQIQTSRTRGELFRGATPPSGLSETRDFLVHAYYVNNAGPGPDGQTIFQLRRKILTTSGTGLGVDDEEIISGVDDLQVQFGIDGPDADEAADGYVNPGAVPANSRVVSVRVWIRVVAEERDLSFQDATPYAYANATPGVSMDNRRRVLLSKTIQLRNSHL